MQRVIYTTNFNLRPFNHVVKDLGMKVELDTVSGFLLDNLNKKYLES